MNEIARIKEMFVSTQGEGPYIGYKQLFIRFCACNLSCKFCDTDYTFSDKNAVYSPSELLELINKDFDLSLIHSISYTGGEPLIHADFLKIFLPHTEQINYLETNATLSAELLKVVDYVDIISADIKLPSATGINGTFELHNEFFKVARLNQDVDLFAKVVLDETITEEEIIATSNLVKRYDIPLIIQPKTNIDGTLPLMNSLEETFDKFLKRHKNTRLIPQVHKFLDIR